jgi:hypothetical protein
MSNRSKKKSAATARRRTKSSSSPPRTPATPETLAAAARPDVVDDKTGQPAPFRPSANQIAYLWKVRELAEAAERPTDVRVSKLLKLSRNTIWAWKQDEGFLRWFSDGMQAGDDIEWRAAMARMLGLAIQGSVRHFEAIARVRSIGQRGGGFTPENASGETTQNFQFNILVPRPPAEPEAKAVTGATA